MLNNTDLFFLVIKSVLLFYIVLSPFFNHKDLWFMNNIMFKIAILILIVFVSFIDMQLAILLTITLLVMIVNTNKHEILMLKNSIPPKIEQEQAKIEQEQEAETHVLTDLQRLKNELILMQDTIKLIEAMPVENKNNDDEGLIALNKQIAQHQIQIAELEQELERIRTQPNYKSTYVSQPPPEHPVVLHEAALRPDPEHPEHPEHPLEAMHPEFFPDAYCPGISNPDLSGSINMWVTDDRTRPYQEFINVLSPIESINNIQSNSF
jgi:hypothetical protein